MEPLFAPLHNRWSKAGGGGGPRYRYMPVLISVLRNYVCYAMGVGFFGFVFLMHMHVERLGTGSAMMRCAMPCDLSSAGLINWEVGCTGWLKAWARIIV
jgi:hypothetical protein